MKKVILSAIVLFGCCALFSGCIKAKPDITSIVPSMVASIGTYDFTASSVIPSTLDTQYQQPASGPDSVLNLYITGHSSDLVYIYDKIVLNITHYNGLTGTFSIVQNQAGAAYYHNGVVSVASGGIVVITRITSNTIIGYFSFTTVDGISVTNGTFTVALPNGIPF
jgi:hypothetical protein